MAAKKDRKSVGTSIRRPPRDAPVPPPPEPPRELIESFVRDEAPAVRAVQVDAPIPTPPVAPPSGADRSPPAVVLADAPPPSSLPALLASVPEMPEARTVVERKDGRKMRRSTFWVEVGLARRVAVYAALHGVDQTSILRESLEEWLVRRGG